MSSLIYLKGALFIVAINLVSADFEICPADSEETYSYRSWKNGPYQWPTLFPNDCSGRSQSPININTFWTEKKELEALGFQNYDVPIPNATIVNNGHTVQIMPGGDNLQRTIVVEGDEYILNQFHFHWALTADKGSEHTVNKMAYAMEVHFVHYASDGRVAVVGVFFKQSSRNDELQTIVNSLSDVLYKGTQTNLKSSLKLSNLLPKEKSFYRYNGSLTTPNCTEGVIWSVMTDSIKVGQPQMKEFRKLFSVTQQEASGQNQFCLIAPNYRPVQQLNGRPVYCSG